MKIYHLLDEPEEASVLGSWDAYLGPFKKVIGYSASSAIFLFDPESLVYLVLYPEMNGNNSKNYGEFSTVEEFESQILQHKDFPDYGLFPTDVAGLEYLESRLGPLGELEVYYPTPSLLLGGDGNLDSYKKGNVWIHTDLIGQNKGL